jgi:DNA modification methylase
MLVCGDARYMPIRSESVQCVVTSPPYWGLRDYGTARWEGGLVDCSHSVGGQVQDNKAPGAITTGQRPGVDASRCRKCGARRIDSQIGLESTPEAYVAELVAVFREVWRVLRKDGTVWLVIGDSYGAAGGDTHSGFNGRYFGKEFSADKQSETAEHFPLAKKNGLRPKNLVGIPWRVAFALQADGWYLRSDIIWSKPNPMPESVTDRPTKAHEYVFLLTKSERYYYDADAIRESFLEASLNTDRVTSGQAKRDALGEMARTTPVGRTCGVHANGRNRRSVWEVATEPYSGAHFAVFPRKLIEPMILAGSRLGDLVFDPFVGSGTTVHVARALGRRGIGLDLKYFDLSASRIYGPLFASTINAYDIESGW